MNNSRKCNKCHQRVSVLEVEMLFFTIKDCRVEMLYSRASSASSGRWPCSRFSGFLWRKDDSSKPSSRCGSISVYGLMHAGHAVSRNVVMG